MSDGSEMLERAGRYRVGRHYGIHVYEGERPVATFVSADEARAFVDAMNGEAVQPEIERLEAANAMLHATAEWLDAESERLKAANERLANWTVEQIEKAAGNAIGYLTGEVERLKAENERLRGAVAGSEVVALEEFADFLDERRASRAQLLVGLPDYNSGVAAALKWAAEEARKRVSGVKAGEQSSEKSAAP